MTPPARAAAILGLAVVLLTTGGAGPAAQAPAPEVQARVKTVLDVDGRRFRDLNGNSTLDAYEDWRRPVA